MAIPAELPDAVRDVMIGIMMDDSDAAADALAVITKHGPPAIVGALHAWSSITIKGMGTPPPKGQHWRVEAVDMFTGNLVDFDQATRMDPHRRDSVQLAVLYGNEDWDTINGMVDIYLKKGPEATVDLMVSTAGLAVAVARHLATPEAS